MPAQGPMLKGFTTEGTEVHRGVAVSLVADTGVRA